jgi:ADP-ribosylglycohydrolase
MPIKNDPKVFEKERKVLEMRLAGVTFEVIARSVGYSSAGSCYNAYKRALIRTLQEPAEAVREAEVARLDRLMQGVWTAALRGEVRSVEAVLRIMDRRAKLMGLDAPTKQQVEVTHYDPTSIDAEVAKLAAILDGRKESSMDQTIGESRTDS